MPGEIADRWISAKLNPKHQFFEVWSTSVANARRDAHRRVAAAVLRVDVSSLFQKFEDESGVSGGGSEMEGCCLRP